VEALHQPKQESKDSMAEDSQGNIISDNVLANGEDHAPQVGMISQYIKDMSVENPNTPQSFGYESAPQIDIQVNIQVNSVSEEVHEVCLRLTAKAECDEGVQFNVELDYASLFGLRNIPAEQSHPFLFGEAPRLMFPFARRIVADAIRDAGYPPLVLEPIDFNMLYLQQRAQADELAEAQPAGEA
jgi:preprotein translocase subunit SecB